MKKLLPIFLGLALAGSANAQTASIVETPSASVSVDPSWTDFTNVPFHASPAAPQAESLKLSYANPNGQIWPWQAPLLLSETQAVLAYAQRFTLPANEGMLDSVKILFGPVQDNTTSGQGSVTIIVLRDAPTADFHFPNLSQAGVLGSATVPTSVFGDAQTLTLNLATPGLIVPTEFFVFVTPTYVTEGNTSIITLPSEVKFNTPRTRGESRSIILMQNGQNQQFSIMDNFFNVPTDTAAVNFFIEAFVQVAGASVARPSISPAAMFPNPIASSSTLNIQHNEQINQVRIVNMLGNEMQSWAGKSTSVKLSTSELSTGVYNVIVNTENGVTTEKLIVN